MNNETVNVQLDKGRLEKLTCVRASGKYEIQWLKVHNSCLVDLHYSNSPFRMAKLILASSNGAQTRLFCHY